MLDAYIACWNAEYHYLVGRPIHFDPTIDTDHLSLAACPSGHACTLTAPATVLGYLFPRDAHYVLSRAEENAASRVWAGIHFRSDVDAGVAMGQEVGKAVIEYAKAAHGAPVDAPTSGSPSGNRPCSTSPGSRRATASWSGRWTAGRRQHHADEHTRARGQAVAVPYDRRAPVRRWPLRPLTAL